MLSKEMVAAPQLRRKVPDGPGIALGVGPRRLVHMDRAALWCLNALASIVGIKRGGILRRHQEHHRR